MSIPIGHIEAGLRSFDRTMPEEINRLVTDALSEHLFTTCLEANENLKKEGVPEDKICFVGNVMIDTLYYSLPKAEKSLIKDKLGLGTAPYVLVTIHRPFNVDNTDMLNDILEGLIEISNEAVVVFPIHPRTRKNILRLEVYNKIKNDDRMRFIEPIGYLDCLNLMKSAAVVITDSGGIQEETTVLGVPCLTLRKNTERPITVNEGTNILLGMDSGKMISETDKILRGEVKKGKIPELWDGKAAERIVAKILNIYT
jgi:UDP-N-acetylglucosamine 2-epimerase (non-hydrolysing)